MTNVVEFPFQREISTEDITMFFFMTKDGLIFSIEPERIDEIWQLIVENDIEFYLE